MSTNNFPLVWDSEADDGLLGSLFPHMNSRNSFPQNTNTEENPFANSPLSKNGKSVRDIFFSSAAKYKYGNFEIIVDPSSGIDPREKIKTIEETFIIEAKGGNRTLDEGEKSFKVKLFISKDENKLEDLFQNPTIKPDENEILLFLEDNSGDWGTTKMLIKKGDRVNNSKFFDILFSENSVFADYIKSKHSISKSDLQELLRKDRVENNALNLISCIFEAVSFFVSDAATIKTVAYGIEKAIEAIRNNCTIGEKSWNPVKAENGATFQPFLFPGIPNILNELDDAKINSYLKEAINSLKQNCDAYHETIENTLLVISKVPIIAVLPFPFNAAGLLPNKNSFSQMLLENTRS